MKLTISESVPSQPRSVSDQSEIDSRVTAEAYRQAQLSSFSRASFEVRRDGVLYLHAIYAGSRWGSLAVRRHPELERRSRQPSNSREKRRGSKPIATTYKPPSIQTNTVRSRGIVNVPVRVHHTVCISPVALPIVAANSPRHDLSFGSALHSLREHRCPSRR